MKFVNNTGDMPNEGQSEVHAFDKTGQSLISSKEKSYAKIVYPTGHPDRKKYYIRIHESVPYDPCGMHSHREQYLETNFQGVSKATFDYYMMFLKTKNFLYMTRTQRSFIND